MLLQNTQNWQALRSLLASGKSIPWRLIRDWKCYACGECCTRYLVELKPWEYAEITHTYGFSSVTLSMGKIYLKRKPDGSCLFLCRLGGKGLCGLQRAKPEVCRLWPFNPLESPLFGYPELSHYQYGRKVFYVYATPACPNIIYGEPSRRFKEKVIPEIIDMKFGGRIGQKYSTSTVVFKPSPAHPLLTVVRV